MPRKTVSRLSNTGLALAGLTLGLGLTHSQPLSAQFSKYSPYGGYGGYGSYGGSRQQQYDDGYQEKSYSNDRGDMVPFKRTGVPVLALVALDAQQHLHLRRQWPHDSAVWGVDGLERLRDAGRHLQRRAEETAAQLQPLPGRQHAVHAAHHLDRHRPARRRAAGPPGLARLRAPADRLRRDACSS